MKFKSLASVLVFAGVLFSACEKKEDLGLPRITVEPVSIALSEGEDSKTVSITATRDWYISSKPDWVGLSIETGKASGKAQEVTVTVNSNPGYSRSGSVVFTIGLANAVLEVAQNGSQGEQHMGSGTLDDPFTVSGVIEYVQGLGADVTSDDQVFIKGKISRLGSETFATSGTFGNATFYISDDGSQNNEFYCYRLYYLGNVKYTSGDDVKVGDDVVICGKVVNYKGNTPETSQGSAFLYSLNGKTEGGYTGGGSAGSPSGSGTQADPYNVAAALDAVKNLSWTSNDSYQKVGPYYVKGKISRLGSETFATSGTFGNATFYISDDGDSSNEFYCYRIYYFGNKKYTSGDDVKVGDEVVICGELMNYRGNTPETVQNSAYLYSLNGNTGDGGSTDQPSNPSEPSGDGTLANPYNAAGVIKYIDSASYNEDAQVYVKGKISSVKYTFSTQYGTANFDISDDGTTSATQFTCYSVLYLENKKWVDGYSQVKVGDEVIIYGKVIFYSASSVYETSSQNAYIYSLNGKTVAETVDPGTQPGGGDGEFDNNVTWSLDESAYTQDAVVNGTSGVTVLKLGTSSKWGKATITLPSAASKLKFYAISWNNATVADLVFTVAGKEVARVTPVANSSLAGNPTYTLTVKDTDFYSIDLGSAVTSVTVETSGGYRAALFGIKSE